MLYIYIYIYIYIYEHEAIQKPISENNIGAPLAPQKEKEWERAVIHRVDVEFECTQSEYNTTGAPHNAVAI